MQKPRMAWRGLGLYPKRIMTIDDTDGTDKTGKIGASLPSVLSVPSVVQIQKCGSCNLTLFVGADIRDTVLPLTPTAVISGITRERRGAMWNFERGPTLL